MARKFILFAVCIFLQIGNIDASTIKSTNEPDSVYLFAHGANGLRFAWSVDKQNYTSIANGHIYLKCDYGRWGTEKKMYAPYLIQGRKGQWVCVWELNNRTPQFALATSTDLVNWGPQSYPYVNQGKNVLLPIITYNKVTDDYKVTYTDSDGKYFQVVTKDFKNYTNAVEVKVSEYANESIKINIGGDAKGNLQRVPWTMITKLKNAYEVQKYRSILSSETTKEDVNRFAGLKNVTAKITLQPKKSKPISTLLTGVFFEDINYAADGGLYAEMIQNRDFEYKTSDKSDNDKNWNSMHSWALKGEKASITIDSLAPIHPNNLHYAVIETRLPGAALINAGFDGIAIKKGDSYNFSAFLKNFKGKATELEVCLVSDKIGVIAKSKLKISVQNWKQLTTQLISSADAVDAKLEIRLINAGKIAFDMVSLFPQKTFNGHKNGLRPDLAQAIAAIHPRFVRFPGGCVAHGDGIENIYKWKNSIGPLESRKPDRNLWGYHQTMGLGYFEYFQFCEDIGAAPVPVIAAGVPCQNSSTGGGGQQGGIPMAEMEKYIQDIIDLVEYANGPVTSTWGKKRAEAGHPKPFNLKYIGIGNEDQITEVFKERFTLIYHALKKAHPEITIIGSAGPFFEGTDYVEGWKIASDLQVPLIDEHYYQSPGWFINNQDFYDNYDRNKSKIYLGEYAASLPGGNKTNLETALAEALYLTSLERNGDVVSMASYAPLIAKVGHTQWNPDLIYFNNSEVMPTTGYFVQQLYGQNAGDTYIPSQINLSTTEENVSKRIAYSIVRDSKTNDLIIKLVNLLPVTVNTSFNFNEIGVLNVKAAKTVITGNPVDKNTKPIVSEINISAETPLDLPAYSFTVLRLKTK
ncbi:alpha-L-arabinofuranosidase [Pedobacter sp. LMG 31464]|uniref:non-reducing end alpha-L-arabinofuranosidase n=1 Tax=Pedobacter planticolens TaxID=2679964 RepID=A0A923IV70_9SPHI|nr:alpha-L-arabinofuranosidase C-terminal domain-containing protein [Pedobacter planticolens]MBB2144884.1 alpha-L-arabinofuranosidase [Pedobacter planticolens]